MPFQRWALLRQQEARATPPARRGEGKRESGNVTTKDEPWTLPREGYIRTLVFFFYKKTTKLNEGIPVLSGRSQGGNPRGIFSSG